MAVRDDFAAGEVLSAADLNDTFASKVDYALPVNAQTGTTYTFVAADAEKLTTASNAAAVTLTIPPQSSVTWSDNTVLRVVNYGAGAVTVAGGSGVTVTNTATTLAQFQAAAVIRTGSDAWTLVPFGGGGVGDADFSNTATGTYTDTGISYKYVTFATSGTLTITDEGLADILLVGGGGGSGRSARGGGGGGGAVIALDQIYLAADTYTVTVGAGGAGTSSYAGAKASSGTRSAMLGVVTVEALGGGGAGSGAQPGFATAATGVGGGGDVGSAGGNNGYTSSSIAGVTGLGGGNAGGGQGGGAGGDGDGTTTPTNGIASSITGTSVDYGLGGPKWASDFGAVSGDPGIGQGGFGNAAESGANGVVVVRVRTS